MSKPVVEGEALIADATWLPSEDVHQHKWNPTFDLRCFVAKLG